MPGGKCPACGSKAHAQLRCQQCGYDDAAAIASYDKVPAFVPWVKLFRRPIPPAGRTDISWKNPLLAACLAAVVIGAGHFYVGKRLEGAGYLATAIVLTWAFFTVSIFALFFLAAVWKMQLMEAYDRAVEFDWAPILQDEMGGPRGR